MSNLATLKSEIDRLSQDARNRRMEAQRLSESATGLRAMGNEDGARAEESQANKLIDEANNLESSVESTSSELRYQESELEKVKQEIDQVESAYQAEIKQLQHRKDELEGSAGSYMPMF